VHNRLIARLRTSKTPYHHGDLRSALLDAAVAAIAESGLPSLSLRECARRVGVSHAAPYRHFEDKRALLMAIATQGFQWLTAAGRAAIDEVEDPKSRLDAYGAAYVRFAFEHPVHHRVMFSVELGPIQADLEQISGGAFGLLLECAAGLVGPGEDPELAAVAAWSLTHGLAMLILDGRIPADRVANADGAAALAHAVFGQWRGPLSGGGP